MSGVTAAPRDMGIEMSRTNRARRPAAMGATLALLVVPALGDASTAAQGDEGARDSVRTRVIVSERNPGPGGLTLRGTVDSPRAACEKGRVVRVRGLGGRVVGRDRADEYGRWRVDVAMTDLVTDTFEVVARRDRVRSGRLVCRRGSTTTMIGAT